ncbi:hydroxyphenylacetyl-CoA thioesterase PaaI [Thermoflexus sp.]|uniref:hydroxyphenylacetyl-CoA thioesterase PaaI n=1 Tax=Thermoflexus sp. TaxID=1969742 RepID=UPI0025D1FFC3|nr:hydroxyphenylacetyl-CoA thioesterase PaaI [Thermoflexus sp.]MDW8179569.1 hydroxyphenylacetyl-CoA thioesterase PaaI [Anaerolineae bacterium]MCS6965129.1 hydroxyphenylacetyl-CoA thioesterase PaaI [Thermoflexus sp.]MCS7350120.1 hydroxyphenylacetyl-CoA thioesterase PaaI [Thermoflexus sp.]MCX7689484.1 hydroxyphenylacetyl-CoA thioesterase PaaI [Thermoflexus sp.]MDW8184651.1 hydroxyphenylacetyl-CoA thioesterase PaaI [Anaerolineae bacterium]
MQDPFMTTLGMEGEILSPGRARTRGIVRPEHLNLHGTAHGGFVYTLADAAFALASNSHGVRAVALSTHMEYLRPVQAGDSLEAIAEEIHRGSRTALYRVEVRRGEELVAWFTGWVYRFS